MPRLSKRTNSEQKDLALKPITLRMGAEMAMHKVDEVMPKYGFDKYKAVFEYHEMYASKGNFEYTISFIEDYGKTHISILIYSDNKIIGLKKNLKLVSLFLREQLESFMEWHSYENE